MKKKHMPQYQTTHIKKHNNMRKLTYEKKTHATISDNSHMKKKTCHNMTTPIRKKHMPEFKATHTRKKRMPQNKTTHIWTKHMPHYKTTHIWKKNTCQNIRQLTYEQTHATISNNSNMPKKNMCHIKRQLTYEKPHATIDTK
jgi:hypothetical protein